MNDKLSRREVLGLGVAFGALVPLVDVACQSKPAALQCTDTTGLSTMDVQLRQTLAYVDVSLDPIKMCTNCQQFVPNPAGNSCGTCKVLKGPINPKGNCKSWAAKPT